MYAIKPENTIRENELITRIIEGNTELYELLIRKNNPFLYKTGRSYGFNHHDTEDLMQEAFVSGYVNLKKYQQRSTFKTWIIKIMLHLCFRKSQKLSYKNEKPTEAVYNEKTKPMFATGPDQDAHHDLLNRELAHIIETSLTLIPLEYRMVFSMRELLGFSTSETAGALSITETNVKVRLNRAKHMLRDKIEKIYSPADIFEFNLVYCNKITSHVMNIISQPFTFRGDPA